MQVKISSFYCHKNIWERDQDFTGIILLPGSFSGRMSSPRPQRGPLSKEKQSDDHKNKAKQ